MSTRAFKNAICVGAVSSVICGAYGAPSQTQNRPNVLFIMVDDLKPLLNCYGNSYVKTPNFDRLAKKGVIFTNAYCQMAICGPSRATILSGLRPDTHHVYTVFGKDHLRAHTPGVTTLPQYFRNHGYHTESYGKVFHGNPDQKKSWSVIYQRYGLPELQKESKKYLKQYNKYKEKRIRAIAKDGDTITENQLGEIITGGKFKYPKGKGGPAWLSADVNEILFPDAVVAESGVRALKKLSKKKKSFFLAVGFFRPHLPFYAPKKYFDMYPKSSIKMPDNYFYPKNCPPPAIMKFGELRRWLDIDKHKMDIGEKKTKELRRAYYACVSFIDAQLGKILDTLKETGLDKNTIVVLLGDHGWKLGEHKMWCKQTNYLEDINSPLIVSYPGCANSGKKTEAIVEFTDIFPTLCDLAGLEIPKGLEGVSFKPVLENPNREWKKAAFTQFFAYVENTTFMGYTVKTKNFRYTEWGKWDYKAKAIKGPIKYRELYDHVKDPKENECVVKKKAYRKNVEELAAILAAGWKGALPKGVKVK